MAKIRNFESNAEAYEHWFDAHPYVYQSELAALRLAMPDNGVGLEVGVGTGRFALPFGIQTGIEPSPAMAAVARQKGIEVVNAVAEQLPFADESFDTLLFVTTLCFLDSLENAFKEAWRVLKFNGRIIIAFIDRESSLGQSYEKNKSSSRFYQYATFYSVSEVEHHLRVAEFNHFSYRQTIFSPIEAIDASETVKKGYGEGAFVILQAEKSSTLDNKL